MKNMTEKKRVLFIGVGLYHYDSVLINQMTKSYIVNYINMFPVKKEHKLKWTIMSHLNKNQMINEMNSQIVLERLKKLGEKEFDYIFIIKGSRLYQCHFDYLKERYPRAKIILYLWDAWSLIENQKVLIDNVDTIYTFDSEDSRKYGFKLRPLFYTYTNQEVQNKRYDVSFIGTDHSDRFDRLKLIKDLCQKNKLKYLFRLKTTNGPMIKARFGWTPYRRDDLDIITNKSLKYDEVLAITRQSRCVIDFSHPAQCGLTMRTLEALALGCKLITTNQYIKEYKDLNPSWYCVLGEDLKANKVLDFIHAPSSDIEIPYNYSIEAFIKELLN